MASSQGILYVFHDGNRTFCHPFRVPLACRLRSCPLMGFLTPVVKYRGCVPQSGMRLPGPRFSRELAGRWAGLFSIESDGRRIALLGPGASLSMRVFSIP